MGCYAAHYLLQLSEVLFIHGNNGYVTILYTGCYCC